jgi:hypothetical protein
VGTFVASGKRIVVGSIGRFGVTREDETEGTLGIRRGGSGVSQRRRARDDRVINATLVTNTARIFWIVKDAGALEGENGFWGAASPWGDVVEGG